MCVCVCVRARKRAHVCVLLRTDAHHEDDEEEGVGDGDDGRGESADDVLERLQATEDANDAKGANNPQDGGRNVDRPEGDQGEDYDGGVDEVEAVADEGA